MKKCNIAWLDHGRKYLWIAIIKINFINGKFNESNDGTHSQWQTDS